MTSAAKAAALAEVQRLMHKHYIFPEVAAKMESVLAARQAEGAYAKEMDPAAFAELLTAHLREASNDKHIRVRHRAPGAVLPPQAQANNANFGFVKAERMPGNVAYIDLRSFNGSPAAIQHASEVMSAAADADALVVDLRQNGGGSPGMVAHMSSYLFDDKPVHLNDLYYRVENSTRSFWTNPKVEGKRFGGSKPVYVLTSVRTFSAAEEFSYNLQQLKRATIIGETTGGGANPGQSMQIGPELFVFVPTGRAINPISKTNWEGVGVKPDVPVPPDQALDRALTLARSQSRVDG
jgi:C-terminal processing protease CtpA/Prc